MKLFVEEGVGGAPKNVFRRLQGEGRIPTHFDDVQLLALPGGTEPYRYIQAIKDQFTGTQAGCFIMYLGDDKIKIPREELTGKCSKNEEVFKGQRKWLTQYVVYTNTTKRYYDSEGTPVDIETPLEISAHDTKGDAVEAAKEYAIQNSVKSYIRLEKRLDANSGKQFIAEYEAQTKTVYDEKVVPQNRYMFFGQFEEAMTFEEAEQEAATEEVI